MTSGGMISVCAMDIRRAAMTLLARREYSFHELSVKLSQHFPGCSIIDEQIHLLAAQNLQSDNRYAASFIRSRVQKRQGPRRISLELSQKGIAETLINQIFEEEAFDWVAIIRSLSESKYGDSRPKDPKEKSKRMRFFQYRGFDFEQIDLVLG